MLSPLVDLGVALALLAVLLAVYRRPPGWSVLAAPLWLALLLLAAFGTSLWLAALNVRFRDVKQALGPVLQVWLFASPVAYPSSALDGGGPVPLRPEPDGRRDRPRPVVAAGSTLARSWPLVVSVVVVLVVLLTGAAYFSRAQRTFADVI